MMTESEKTDIEQILQQKVNSAHQEILNKGYFPNYIFVLSSDKVMQYLKELNDGLDDKQLLFYQELKPMSDDLKMKKSSTEYTRKVAKTISEGVLVGN